ncbi:hypothetical protein [Nocardia sp. NPDC050435]|uniref:hypothetical protein n=1 Tax=Nocardia sp. NPDC050435 TaxID=3155040 RepID=UPI0033D401E3
MMLTKKRNPKARKADRTVSTYRHPITPADAVSPWDCNDTGALTVTQARQVRSDHSTHWGDCAVSKTAKKTLARLIDAPTVRVKVGAQFDA